MKLNVRQDPKQSADVETLVIPRITAGVFVVHEETAKLVANAASDRRMKQATIAIKMGGIPAATDTYRNQPPPNLLVVEAPANRDQLLGQLELLAEECSPDTQVIVIGQANDVTLFRELMERGVSDYLVSPEQPLALIAAIARIYRTADAGRLGRITAFIGAKGGVGSSAVAENVAAGAAELDGPDVLLADLNLPFGSVGLDLNVDPVQGLADLVRGSERLDEVLVERLSSQRKEGLRVLASSCALDENCEMNQHGLERLLDISKSTALHLMLDLPQAWTPWVKESLRSADDIVITAEPDLVSMRNTKNLAEILSTLRPNDMAPRLVLNRVGMPKRPEIKPEEFAAAVDLELTARLSFDPAVFGRAANEGRFVVDLAPASPAAQDLGQLARLVSGQKLIKSKRGAAFYIRRLFGRK